MSGNPWLDDDIPGHKVNSWNDGDEQEFDPDKDPLDYSRQVIKRKEIDMVQSTQRSLALLNDSEQIGSSTATELMRQGEVLKRTERRVDQMDKDLKESDRHIQSIKSIWGAFMNKFRKEPEPAPVKVYDDSPSPDSKLSKAVTASQAADYDTGASYESHPVLARQNEGRRQFRQTESTAKNERMQEIDNNLDLMMGGLRRLKDLGLGMQEEIDSQDVIIGRLGNKVEKVDMKTHETNKKLLKLNNS